MEVVAVQKFILSSPKKLREVVYLIRKMTPGDAVERLPFSGKRAAGDLRKVIMTAIANAKQKGVNPVDLTFKDIQINEGPRLKRFHAGSRGRAKPYKKRMSHIRIVLTTDIKKVDEKEVKPAKKSATEEVKALDVKAPKAVKTEKKVTKKAVKTKK